MPKDVVRIDGVSPAGWEFVRFQVYNRLATRDDETYVGVVARYVGDGKTKAECVVEERPAGPWLRVFDAADFVQDALQKLN